MQRFYDSLNSVQPDNKFYFAKLAQLTRLNPAHLDRLAANLYWNEWS